MKKILALVVALMLVLGMSSAFAATITVTPPEGIDDAAENTYTIYQVFTGIAADTGEAISYQLPAGITAPPAGFSVDTAGNVTLTRTTGDLTKLTDDEIAGIKDYITANKDDLWHTSVDVTGRAVATFDNLGVGYYFIDTTVGTLVTVDTVRTTLALQDKNSIPSLTKEITGASGTITDSQGHAIDPSQVDDLGKHAIGQIGTYVEYESVITVAKGMRDYLFHDTMDEGLALDTASIQVTYSATPEGYTEAQPVTGKNNGKDTITINFTNGLAEGTTITITYRAMITNEALTVDPEMNTAYLEYGHGPTTGKTPEQRTETYAAKIGLYKYDNSDSTKQTAVPDAGFKLYKFVTEGGNQVKKYYHYDTSTKTVSWGDKADGDERITDANGEIAPFIGLDDGTYYLEETTVPHGYKTPTADIQVVIAGTEYSHENLEQHKEVPNEKGTSLPSTGGIGTTIFYVGGGILVVLAVVFLVTKRRMNADD